MKKITETEYAKELLQQKADGFSIRRILRRTKRRYILSSCILAIGIIGICLRPEHPMYWVITSVYVGAFLRDYGWFKAAKRQWPLAEKMIDWVKVKEVANQTNEAIASSAAEPAQPHR